MEPLTDPIAAPDDIPDVLPVLPLKETVVFPESMTPLAIGQERSIQLVDDVVGGDRLTIVVEIPGADPDAIRVAVDGRRLVISGERPRPRGDDDDLWYRSEIEYGPFERELELSDDVSARDAEASYERGLLRIVLPIAKRRPSRRARAAIEVRRVA